jgi:hypothetical protein
MAKKENGEQVKPELSMTELIKRTNKENPKPADLKLLRQRLDDDGDLVKVNEVGERAIASVIDSYTNSALVRELQTRQVKDKRRELGYENASVMERMLINQVILCHLRMTTLEGIHAAKFQERHSTESGLYWDRLLTTYQRRFHKACESLAKVRKLLAEASAHEERARNARSAAAKRSVDIYKSMTADS